MENLNELYSELFYKVMEDNLVEQQYYLSMVEDHRKISVDYLLELGALFIPNNDYIEYYLGSKVHSSSAGLYYQGQCPWTLFVIIPVRNLMGEIVGLVGWDAYNKYKEVSQGERGLVSYRVSAKSVFPREKFFLSDVECLKREFNSRVIFVTDGVFDAISLNYRSLPAIALLGSSFSPEILYFLSWYKAVYVCADNDSAGLALVRKLSRALPNVHRVIQNRTKDIEELLRTDGLDGHVTKQLRQLCACPVRGDFILDVEDLNKRIIFKKDRHEDSLIQSGAVKKLSLGEEAVSAEIGEKIKGRHGEDRGTSSFFKPSEKEE